MLAYQKQSAARMLLPEAVAMLGIPEQMVLVHPDDHPSMRLRGRLFTWQPPAGLVLCSDADGREMFLLRPLRDAGRMGPRQRDQAVRVRGLYERFHHKASDGYYNTFVPAFELPHFRGYIQTIRYVAEKCMDAESCEGPIEWEHAFHPDDEDDTAVYEVRGEGIFMPPDYAELHHVGKNQFYIPRGNWRITAAGIQHHRDH